MGGVRAFPFSSFRRKPESILISSGIPIKSKMDPGMRRDDEQKLVQVQRTSMCWPARTFQR